MADDVVDHARPYAGRGVVAGERDVNAVQVRERVDVVGSAGRNRSVRRNGVEEVVVADQRLPAGVARVGVSSDVPAHVGVELIARRVVHHDGGAADAPTICRRYRESHRRCYADRNNADRDGEPA